ATQTIPWFRGLVAEFMPSPPPDYIALCRENAILDLKLMRAQGDQQKGDKRRVDMSEILPLYCLRRVASWRGSYPRLAHLEGSDCSQQTNFPPLRADHQPDDAVVAY